MARAQHLSRPAAAPARPDASARSVRRELATAVAVVAMLAAALGLAVGGLYGDDAATVQMLRGFDAVTLVVIGPALLLAVRADRRGAVTGRLMVASLLTYLAYTLAYYLLGAGLTDVLLLHAALLSLTVVALAMTVHGTITDALADRTRRVEVRIPVAVLGLLAVALGGMWSYALLAHAIAGTTPVGSSLVESDAVVHLGIVLDLTILVPLYGAAAVLLWRRRTLGFVLAVVALVAGTLHQVSYVVALLFQSAAAVAGSVVMDPVEPVILLLYGVATAVLLRPPHVVRP